MIRGAARTAALALLPAGMARGRVDVPQLRRVARNGGGAGRWLHDERPGEHGKDPVRDVTISEPFAADL